jgi:hypothetical protein
LVDVIEFLLNHRHDNELRNSLTALELERGRTVVDQQHMDLTAVPGIDHTGPIDHANPVASRKAGSWRHKADMAFGDSHRKAGRHHCPLLGLDPMVAASVEIHPCITRMGMAGERKLGI